MNRWNARPGVLDELLKAASQATPLATGESFATRVRDFTEAQLNVFRYQGKLHALRFASVCLFFHFPLFSPFLIYIYFLCSFFLRFLKPRIVIYFIYCPFLLANVKIIGS